jgi:hypothetical protein
LSEDIPARSSLLFCIIAAALEQIKTSITPMGIKKTALEMISLVEIFSLEKSIFPPVYEEFYTGIVSVSTRRTQGKKIRIEEWGKTRTWYF